MEIFVQNGLTVYEPITNALGELASVSIGYTGTAAASIEAAFTGTLVAPNAQVTLGTASYHEYTGSFVVRDLVLGPDTHLTCSVGGGAPGPGESCYDDVLNQDETGTDCGGVCAGCVDGEPCNDNDDCLSESCLSGICSPAAGSCTELNAIDMGWHGKVNYVSNDACLMIRDAYPYWWGVRNVQLQPMWGGSYPVPFTWSSACMSSSGNGALQASWQGEVFGPTSNECATIIDLGGDGAGMLWLRYWAN